MSDELNLEKVVTKAPGELEEKESAFLQEHVGELSDEQKETFKEVLEKKEPEKEKGVNFETEEQFQAYLDKHYEGRREQEKIDRKQVKQEQKLAKGQFFSKGYAPKDWNEYTSQVLNIVRQDRQAHTKAEREQMMDIDRRMDEETEDLRAIDPSIPATGTKERREFDRQIAQIMHDDYKNIARVSQAYAILKKGQTGEDEKKKAQTNIAKKVGGGGGSASDIKPVKYKKFASRDMDAAQEAAEKKWDSLS